MDRIAPLTSHLLSSLQATGKPSLLGATRADIGDALLSIGVAPKEIRMRTAQLWHWIYFRGTQSFGDMANVSKTLRAKLDEHFSLARPEVVAEQVSADGTRKWLIRFAPSGTEAGKGAEVECVYIPESDRGTLCVSSQVGCTLTCSFCHTGTQKLVRNLSTQEIVSQLVVARDRIGDFPGLKAPEDGLMPAEGSRFISNIVFMGMGEPLYNFDHVRDAIAVLGDGEGLSLSKRRITVSTAGVVPQMAPLGSEAGAMLAISLHAVRDDLRDTLVPLNKKYPLRTLLDACKTYPGASNARRITFEYVMLKGVNDTPTEARELVRLLKGIPAKINLIPFNPWPGSPYECSDWDRINKFSDIVFNAGYASPVRTPRGRDILAACGQLKSETEKLRARAKLVVED
jgi:23S rRNA (adenine2503-C2)-methyltransferase